MSTSPKEGPQGAKALDDGETSTTSDPTAAGYPEEGTTGPGAAAQEEAAAAAAVKEEESHVITEPHPIDVIMGRGAPSTDHAGNVFFRELVKERRSDYVNAKRRKDKQVIANEIINAARQRGSRFLERVETFRRTNKEGLTTKVTIWQPVNDQKTLLVKVKQLMRDVGPEAQQKRNLRREKRKTLLQPPREEDEQEKAMPAPPAPFLSSTAATMPFAQPAPMGNPLVAGSASMQGWASQLPFQYLPPPPQALPVVGILPSLTLEQQMRLHHERILRQEQLRLLLAAPPSAAAVGRSYPLSLYQQEPPLTLAAPPASDPADALNLSEGSRATRNSPSANNNLQPRHPPPPP